MWARIQEAAPNLWTIENPVKSAPIISGMLRIVQVSQHEKQHSNSFILAQLLYLLPKSPWGGRLPGESPWPRAQKTYVFLQRFWFSQVEHCKARSTKGLRASLLIMRLALLSSVLISPTPHQLSHWLLFRGGKEQEGEKGMGLVGPDSTSLMHDNFHKDLTWSSREQMATPAYSQKPVSMH